MSFNADFDESRPPGRPKEFDHDQVVSGAMAVFWRNGYEGTSLADLEAELSVNRSTLYASFDGKAGLYEAAVDAYVQSMAGLLVRPLLDGSAGLLDLLAFLERLCDLLADPTTPDGCLIVNAMGSGNPPELMSRHLSNLRAGFNAALARAAEQGEIPGPGRDEKASSILSAAIGLNVIAKAGNADHELERMCDGLEAMINGWRQSAVA